MNLDPEIADELYRAAEMAYRGAHADRLRVRNAMAKAVANDAANGLLRAAERVEAGEASLIEVFVVFDGPPDARVGTGKYLAVVDGEGQPLEIRRTPLPDRDTLAWLDRFGARTSAFRLGPFMLDAADATPTNPHAPVKIDAAKRVEIAPLNASLIQDAAAVERAELACGCPFTANHSCGWSQI